MAQAIVHASAEQCGRAAVLHAACARSPKWAAYRALEVHRTNVDGRMLVCVDTLGACFDICKLWHCLPAGAV